MIVKVQLSIESDKPKRQVLVYNKSRSVLFEGDAPRDIIMFMLGEFKAYFHAHLNREGKVVLDKRARCQPW